MYCLECKAKEIKSIEYFYLGAFNEDYSKLLYAWLVPYSFIDNKLHITVNMKNVGEHNIFNMKDYEITNKCNFDMFK